MKKQSNILMLFAIGISIYLLCGAVAEGMWRYHAVHAPLTTVRSMPWLLLGSEEGGNIVLDLKRFENSLYALSIESDAAYRSLILHTAGGVISLAHVVITIARDPLPQWGFLLWRPTRFIAPLQP